MDIIALRVPDHVAYEELDGDVVLLNSQSSTYFRLNRVGSRFWNLLRSGDNGANVLQTLRVEFAVDEATLVSDLEALVEDLIAHGLLVVREQPVNDSDR